MEPYPSSELAIRVQNALRNSDPVLAETLCADALRRDPGDVYALSYLSQFKVQQGQPDQAIELALRASQIAPESAVIQQNLGLAMMAANRPREACRAFQKSTMLAPEDVLYAMFLALAEAECGDREAACGRLLLVYRSAPELRQAWRNQKNPRPVREAARRANQILHEQHAEKHQLILTRLQQQHGTNALRRVSDYLALFHGQTEPLLLHPLQRPSYQLFPGLCAEPFHAVSQFSWVRKLEAAWPAILNEYRQVRSGPQAPEPYVHTGDNTPESWSPLVEQNAWNALHLYRRGHRQSSACERCPKTARLLQDLPQARYGETSPEAFFSTLQPGAHIPPHYGLANIKLTVHLGLEIPQDCGIRVGLQTRHWEAGKALLFDDSFIHEAWNHGSRDRSVFIFEIWHPDLTSIEIDAIAQLAEVSVYFEARSNSTAFANPSRQA